MVAVVSTGTGVEEASVVPCSVRPGSVSEHLSWTLLAVEENRLSTIQWSVQVDPCLFPQKF